MIRLKKAPLPKALEELMEERRKKFFELQGLGSAIPDSLASSYKDKKIKDLLRAETSDKCAYCESKVSHVDHGDVEHILPKSMFPNLRFSFQNLTYACGMCNTRKSDYYDATAPLLNPYEDDPSNHLLAEGPLIMRRPGSDRGNVTQRKLGLNRLELVERRTERLEAVNSIADQIAQSTNPAVRKVLIDQINQECLEDKEYAFVVQRFVSRLLALISEAPKF